MINYLLTGLENVDSRLCFFQSELRGALRAYISRVMTELIMKAEQTIATPNDFTI